LSLFAGGTTVNSLLGWQGWTIALAQAFV